MKRYFVSSNENKVFGCVWYVNLITELALNHFHQNKIMDV